MKKTVLLVNPWIYDFAAYDFWLAPLGLLYLGGFLRKNGYDVQLIDCLRGNRSANALPQPEKSIRRFSSGHGHFRKEIISKPEALKSIGRNYRRYGISPDEFRIRLRNLKHPDLILVTSMMTYWYPAVFDTIKILREVLPGVPVILGGNYVTLCPTHARGAGADRIVSGEGESELVQILKDFINEEAGVQVDPLDLDSYPYPVFDLYDPATQISILTSKGCPYHCTYCASRLINRGYRRRRPERVADEIEYWLGRTGVTHFSFYDDALLVHPEEMIIPLLEEIVRRNLSCRFHCPNGMHLRDMSPTIAELMFKSGFQTLRFGFETMDIARQMETGGKVTNDHLKDAVACLRHAGYASEDIGIYLLCGLPGQSAVEVADTISFVKSCGARPIMAEYSPIPGTALWEASVRISPDPIGDEPLFHNNSLLPCRNPSFTCEDYQALKRQTRIP